jgi:hypothetical protein
MQPVRPGRRMRAPPRIALSTPRLPVWRSRLAPDPATTQIFLSGHQNRKSNKRSGVSLPAIRPAGRGNRCGKPAMREVRCSLCHPRGRCQAPNLYIFMHRFCHRFIIHQRTALFPANNFRHRFFTSCQRETRICAIPLRLDGVTLYRCLR